MFVGMEKSSSVVFSAILVLSGTIYVIAYVGNLKNFSGSGYSFDKKSNGNGYSWSCGKKICEKLGYNLVSIESREEWNFLNKTIQTMTTKEYFIGLKKDTAGVWSWLSDNSTVNASKIGEWPWALDEPNNNEFKENCSLMYKDYRKNYGRYNDIDCSKPNKEAGFICEFIYEKEEKSAKVTASTITAPTDKSQALKTVPVKQSPTTTSETHLEHFSSTTFGNTITDNLLVDDLNTRKPHLVIIVAVLITIFIVILVIAFGLLFFRRQRRHSEDRVICTYEKPLSAAQTSVDPVLVQQTQNSTELTVHLTLSRTESDLATYETLSDCQKECEYDDTDDTRPKSRTASEEYLDIQERARKNTIMSGERGIKQPPSFHDEKEENKDPFYAVVHKQRKGRARSEASALEKTSGRRAVVDNTNKKDHVYAAVLKQKKVSARSEASALKTSPGRPQERKSGLPVNRVSYVGIEDHTKTAMNETPQAGENAEYLYAVVDKTNKKKKAPQVPAPYRSLVYPVLVHSQENSA